MEPTDWPAVHRIYADGIATGDATLEREAPGLGPFRADPTGTTAAWWRASNPAVRPLAGSP